MKAATIPALAARRLLVVEDEFMVAEHIAMLLEDFGCEVVGPVGTIEQALEYVAELARRPHQAARTVRCSMPISMAPAARRSQWPCRPDRFPSWSSPDMGPVNLATRCSTALRG